MITVRLEFQRYKEIIYIIQNMMIQFLYSIIKNDCTKIKINIEYSISKISPNFKK